jgi:hypothetical protein
MNLRGFRLCREWWVDPLAVRSKQPELVYQRRLWAARSGVTAVPLQYGDHSGNRRLGGPPNLFYTG